MEGLEWGMELPLEETPVVAQLLCTMQLHYPFHSWALLPANQQYMRTQASVMFISLLGLWYKISINWNVHKIDNENELGWNETTMFSKSWKVNSIFLCQVRIDENYNVIWKREPTICHFDPGFGQSDFNILSISMYIFLIFTNQSQKYSTACFENSFIFTSNLFFWKIQLKLYIMINHKKFLPSIIRYR